MIDECFNNLWKKGVDIFDMMSFVNDNIFLVKLFESRFFLKIYFVWCDENVKVLSEDMFWDEFVLFFFGVLEYNDIEFWDLFGNFFSLVVECRFGDNDEVRFGDI